MTSDPRSPKVSKASKARLAVSLVSMRIPAAGHASSLSGTTGLLWQVPNAHPFSSCTGGASCLHGLPPASRVVGATQTACQYEVGTR